MYKPSIFQFVLASRDLHEYISNLHLYKWMYKAESQRVTFHSFGSWTVAQGFVKPNTHTKGLNPLQNVMKRVANDTKMKKLYAYNIT